MKYGKSFIEALKNMRKRIPSDAVNNVILSIIEATESRINKINSFLKGYENNKNDEESLINFYEQNYKFIEGMIDFYIKNKEGDIAYGNVN